MPSNDLKTRLAQLMWGENSGATEDEALAIGDTVFNRADLAGWPENPDDVLSQPRQYHPFDPASPNYPRTMEMGPAHPEWSKYVAWAEKVLDPSRARTPFTHYFNGPTPVWAKDLPLTRMGAHYFAKEPRRPKKRPSGVKVAKGG